MADREYVVAGPEKVNLLDTADQDLIRVRVRGDTYDRFVLQGDGTYATGTGSAPPTQSGTTAALSPRSYGAVGNYNPITQTGTDDTTALAAWATAVSALGVGYLPAGYWKTTLPIVFTGGVTLFTDGVAPLYATTAGAAGADVVDTPAVEPFIKGSVIVQCGASQDGVTLTTPQAVNIVGGLGVLFDKTIRYTDTGHGISVLPPTISGGRDQGIMGARWEHIVVFGHDGNHYGVSMVNSLYSSIDLLESFGGGGFYFQNNHPTWQYGNIRVGHAHIEVQVSGTADGVRLTYTGSTKPNLFHFGRCQSSVRSVGTIGGLTPTAPATTQQCFNADPLIDLISIDDPDFEGTVAGRGGVTMPTAKSFAVGGGGAGNLSAAGVPYVMTQRPGLRESASYRRLLSDLSQKLSFAESAGNKWPLVALHDTAALAVATDGSRNVFAPGPLVVACGASGDRPSAVTAGVGAQWYDTTLKKVLFSDGTQWTDAAGTAVAAAAAGASAAADGFTRSNSTTTLGRADSGQVWGYDAVFDDNPFGPPTWGISSNKAYAPGNNSLEVFALLPTNLADCTIQVTLDTVNSNKDTGLVFRFANPTSYWKVNALNMKRTGGSTITHSTPFASGDVMKVILSGSSVTVQRNGATVSTTTDSYNSTEKTHGLRCYDDRGSSRWSAFSIVAP